MSLDPINGFFEFAGSALLWLNVAALVRDKKIAGIKWYSVAFWTLWGLFNCAYYPSLSQWWSFAGGVSVVSVNCVWLALLWKYSRSSRSLSYVEETVHGVEPGRRRFFRDDR
jgi:hypothetical protein